MKIRMSSTNLSQAHWLDPREHNLPVYSVADIRQLEAMAFDEVDSYLLMQAAGMRSARKIIDLLQHNGQPNPQCVVLAGPGNNGGDAYIVATELLARGYAVELIDPTYHATEGTTGSQDRQKAFKAWAATGEPVLGLEDLSLEHTTIVIDGLLGIGCHAKPKEPIANIIIELNKARQAHLLSPRLKAFTVVSLDCPSGLDCDTGLAYEGVAVHADLTLTYIGLKSGLLMSEGKSLCGDLLLEPLGCETLQLSEISPRVSSDRALARNLPTRAAHLHKGDFGSVAIVGGSTGMQGAAILSARTALRTGAGRVSITCPEAPSNPPLIDLIYPEIMSKTAAQLDGFADVLVVGPGLGESDRAYELLCEVLGMADTKHLVLDADALNLIASHPALCSQLVQLRAHIGYNKALIITPHPLEAARLLNCSVTAVQSDRINSAKRLADMFHGTVVLKGAGSLVSDGYRTHINQTGNAALATAGSGDVLAGLIGSLLGQSDIDAFELVRTAVWLHGYCVEALPGEVEPLYLTHAGNLIDRMNRVINHHLHQRASGHS